MTTQTVTIPSNPADQKKILASIKEASDSMIRTESERDQIKAIIDDVNEKYQLPKKYIRALIRAYHKQNISTMEQEKDDIVALYTTIVGK